MKYKWFIISSLIFFLLGQYYYYNVSFHIGLLLVIISSTLFMIPVIKNLEENEKNESDKISRKCK